MTSDLDRIKKHVLYKGSDIAGPLEHEGLDDLFHRWYVEMRPDERVVWNVTKSTVSVQAVMPGDGDPQDALAYAYAEQLTLEAHRLEGVAQENLKQARRIKESIGLTFA